MAALFEWMRSIAFQIDLAAAAIAVIALFVSFMVARRQARLEVENLRLQRDNDVIDWGNDSIDVLAQLEAIADFDVKDPDLAREFNATKIRLMAELSAAIDKGRLYFPNVNAKEVGLHKDSAFRGYRRPILDALVDAYRVAEGYRFNDTEPMREVRAQIYLARRKFVSELQKAVNPERRRAFLSNAGSAVDEVNIERN